MTVELLQGGKPKVPERPRRPCFLAHLLLHLQLDILLGRDPFPLLLRTSRGIPSSNGFKREGTPKGDHSPCQAKPDAFGFTSQPPSCTCCCVNEGRSSGQSSRFGCFLHHRMACLADPRDTDQRLLNTHHLHIFAWVTFRHPEQDLVISPRFGIVAPLAVVSRSPQRLPADGVAWYLGA